MTDFATAFRRGVDHFNALEFWEAHEAWEEIWLLAQTEVEQFLQGLIQLAAAYHHLKRGTFRGGLRLFDAALGRLDRFPRPYCGLDLRDVERVAGEHRAWTAARLRNNELDHRLQPASYPKLFLLSNEISPWPPSSDW